jgi:hypothetical protein
MVNLDWTVMAIVIAGSSVLLARVIAYLGLSRVATVFDIVAGIAAIAFVIPQFGQRALDLVLRPTECNRDFYLCTIERVVAVFWITACLVILLIVATLIRTLLSKKN